MISFALSRFLSANASIEATRFSLARPAILSISWIISTTAVDAGGWWKSEFTLDLANEGDGTIVYRENKNVSDNLSELGYECNVKAGQKVHINFTTGKGKVE